MVDSEIKEPFHSGFIALLGRPNVGKSTLLNAILHQHITPVSFRPQTTRRRQLAILSLPEAQLVFVDTPGLHEPHHKLGERMNDYAREAITDVDLTVVVFDASSPPHEEDQQVAELAIDGSSNYALLSVLNKIDMLGSSELVPRFEAYQSLLPNVELIPTSATGGQGLDEFLGKVKKVMPIGPKYYPEEEVTDLNEREIAGDLIRAAAMQHLRKELPYAIAVRIDKYKERGKTGSYIEATIFVERESQKGIVIGSGGGMLRKIGISAREGIEAMSGRKVYLDLRVKVLPRWRNNGDALARLGYKPVDKK